MFARRTGKKSIVSINQIQVVFTPAYPGSKFSSVFVHGSSPNVNIITHTHSRDRDEMTFTSEEQKRQPDSNRNPEWTLYRMVGETLVPLFEKEWMSLKCF